MNTVITTAIKTRNTALATVSVGLYFCLRSWLKR